MHPAVDLRLASRSPRRERLLREAGIPFRRGPYPDIDETLPAGVSPPEAVRRVAERKARAVLGRVDRGAWILAADTLVFLGDDVVLGKPADHAEAIEMLGRLSGRRHRVATGVAVVSSAGLVSDAAVAAVTFRRLTPDEIRDYVAGGEPLGKAGAYAIQGAGSRFVRAVEGHRDTVVGLPLGLVRHLLARARLEFDATPGR